MRELVAPLVKLLFPPISRPREDLSSDPLCPVGLDLRSSEMTPAGVEALI